MCKVSRDDRMYVDRSSDKIMPKFKIGAARLFARKTLSTVEIDCDVSETLRVTQSALYFESSLRDPSLFELGQLDESQEGRGLRPRDLLTFSQHENLILRIKA